MLRKGQQLSVRLKERGATGESFLVTAFNLPPWSSVSEREQ